jgi:CRP-like cAMP-binding protein
MAFYTTEEILDYFKSGSIREHRLDSEEILFRLGEAVQRIYFIKKGEVRAETYLENGKAIVFFRAQEGHALGEENLFLPNYVYSAIVSSPGTVVVSVPRNELLEILYSQKIALDGFISCLAQRYSDALMAREIIAIRSAEERLMTWLQWKANFEGGSKTINLTGKMGALGSDLDLSKEAVYRAFKDLEDSGSISRTDGIVKILSPST